jgi:hypothetical protein
MEMKKFALTGGAHRISDINKLYCWSERFHSRALGNFSLNEGKKGELFYA